MELISFDQFKNKLEKEYDIDCYIFLEDLETLPSSTLYKILSPYQKSQYNNNYRFILCNACTVKQTTLEHVVNVFEYLDISPYFINVYTNQPSTDSYFKSLIEPIQVTSLNIQRPAPASTDTPLFNNNRTMCAYAWAGIHIWTDGTTSPCCEYTGTIKSQDGTPYNVNTHTITEILSSAYMDNLRDQMRNNINPSGCKKCVVAEANGRDSRRVLAPYRLENVWGNIDWESNNVDKNLGYVGGHLGNLCNLKCRICSPLFSSSIAAEELQQVNASDIKNHPVYRTLNTTSWPRKNKNFWNSLRDNSKQIKNFEFLGGEPFMLQQNFDFMQFLIDHGYSQECIFDFTSNGTIYPEIFEQVDRFKRIDLTLSIDNIGPRFEYERSGSSWQKVTDNIEKFMMVKNNHNKLKIGVAIAVNIQNVYYLPELITWLKQYNFDHYYYNMLNDPEYLSITKLTLSAKQLVLNKLTKCQLDTTDHQKLQPVIQLINGSTGSSGKQFVSEMKNRDRIRNENFAETHPEIATAMGYHETI